MPLFRRINLTFRTELYGFLSLWIMLFHLNMFFNPLLGNVYLGRLASLGESCVDVFLFLSGYCIYFSWNKSPDYLGYAKKRIFRILPSCLILAIPYFIWRDGLDWRVLYDISGISFFMAGDLDVWFPIAILLFYAVTPLLIRTFKGKAGVGLFILLVGASYILSARASFFIKTSIMWSRLPAYSLGVFYALKTQESGLFWTFDGKKAQTLVVLTLSLVCLLLFVLTPLLSVLKSTLGRAACMGFLLAVFPIIFLFNQLAKYIPALIRRFFGFCGDVSFELYLAHLFLLYVVSHYGMNNVFYPLALLTAIPVAYYAKKVSKLVFR